MISDYGICGKRHWEHLKLDRKYTDGVGTDRCSVRNLVNVGVAYLEPRRIYSRLHNQTVETALNPALIFLLGMKAVTLHTLHL